MKINEIVAMNKIYKKEIKRLNERNAEMLKFIKDIEWKYRRDLTSTDKWEIKSIIDKNEEVVKCK